MSKASDNKPKGEGEPGAEKAKERRKTGPHNVVVETGQRFEIEVTRPGEDHEPIAVHIMEVNDDGSLRVYVAPPPASPVQDPDPISDPSRMAKKKGE